MAEIRAEADRIAARVEARVRETLERFEQAVTAAGPRTAPPRAESTRASAISGHLSEALRSVDRNWTRTIEAASGEEPVVR